MKFNAVNYKKRRRVLSVSGLCGGLSAVSLACISSMCFLFSVSLRPLSLFGLWIIHLPPSLPFIFLVINQCNRFLVPLAWRLMAWRCRFTNHGGITLSRGWLCQKWKPLDIPGTHPHLATHLLINLSVNSLPSVVFRAQP